MLMYPRSIKGTMDAETAAEREAKKLSEIEYLRSLTPGQRLEMGFQMMSFAAELRHGAERSRAKA